MIDLLTAAAPMSWVLSLVAILLLVTRYIKAVEPLWTWLPDQWTWLPPTLLTALDLAVNMLPDTTTNAEAAEVILRALVIIALGFGRGLHPPKESTKA